MVLSCVCGPPAAPRPGASAGIVQTSPTLGFYHGEIFSIITRGRTNSPTAAAENLEPSVLFAAHTLRQFNDLQDARGWLIHNVAVFRRYVLTSKAREYINNANIQSVPDTGRSTRDRAGASVKLPKNFQTKPRHR